MAKTFRRVTKAHRAALSAAATKRWAKREHSIPTTDKGLISRMTQAIDKIKEQIERLESL